MRDDKTSTVQGKVCLITGSSSGIGFETARALAKMEAKVILHGGNSTKTIAAFQKLLSQGLDVTFLLADFSSLLEVNAMVRQIADVHPKIDVLINNAGMINSTFQLSDEGFEKQFAINHLAHFFLTTSLLDLQLLSPGARVINVSSDAHYRVTDLDIDSINKPEYFQFYETYSRSKLCNVLFSNELARRTAKERCTFNALHPGVIATRIGSKNMKLMGLGWSIMKPLMKKVSKGAETSVFLASSLVVEGMTGRYFDQSAQKESSPLSQDPLLASKLWKYSRTALQAHVEYPVQL